MLSALSRQKPAIVTASMHASAPPATITLASPYLTIRNASPMAWAPLAHAVDAAWFGPWNPCRMLTRPAGMFTSTLGMKNGLRRRSLPSPRSKAASVNSDVQLMPAPMDTPVSCRPASSSGRQRACRSASSAATRA